MDERSHNSYALQDSSSWISRYRLPSSYWIFLAASFFFDLGLSIYYFLFNLFLLGHGYNEKNLGLLTSAMAVGNLAGTIPAGKLARRFGIRAVLLACFTLISVVCAARVLFLSLPFQLGLAFCAGLAFSIWVVCMSPAVAQLTDEKHRPLAFSLLFSLGIGMGAAGGLAGSRLPAYFARHHMHSGRLEPEQIVLLLSCVIVAIGLWPAAKLRFKRPPEAATRSRPLFASPFLRRYLPAIAIWSVVTGSFSPLASVYLAKNVHLSLQQIGNAFSLSQMAQVAAVLLAPMLFRRWGLINGILFTQLSTAAMLCLLSSSLGPTAVTSVYICFNAFLYMNEPGLFSLLMNSVPEEDRTSASAANNFVASASQAVTATVFGAAFVRYGYPITLRVIVVAALLAIAIFANLRKKSWQLSLSSRPKELDGHSAA